VRDNRPARSSSVPVLTKEAKVTAAEQRLLGLLLADANLRHDVLPILKKEDYEDLATAPLFEALFALDREGTEVDFDALIRRTEGDEFAASVVPMVLMNSSLHGSNEHYVADECVSTFRRMKIEHRIEELKRELVVAEREDDSERLVKLVAERIELDTRRQMMLQPQRQ
jgi:replicative DNA helicase